MRWSSGRSSALRRIDGKPTVALGAEVPNATIGTVLAGIAIGVAAYCGLPWIQLRLSGRQFAHALKRCFGKFRLAIAFILSLAAAAAAAYVRNLVRETYSQNFPNMRGFSRPN
uniref:Uncharacterized protein n=1 Tax=Ananas comosus var. bracteatus TaxID=296719 RepID=A0A6V7NWJ0_ANACO|nr:unnamed protein product [Ananas comosus var. bracteatus]